MYTDILVRLYEIIFLAWCWELAPEFCPGTLDTSSISCIPDLIFSALHFLKKVCLCILLGFSEYAVIIYIITLFLFLIKTITARRWQCFLCVESKRPLSCGVLKYLKTTLNSRKSGHNLLSSTSRRYSVNQLHHLVFRRPQTRLAPCSYMSSTPMLLV